MQACTTGPADNHVRDLNRLRASGFVSALRSRRCAGILLGVPLLAGFIVSRIIADPLFVFVESRAPMAFAPTDAQKVGARSECTRGSVLYQCMLESGVRNLARRTQVVTVPALLPCMSACMFRFHLDAGPLLCSCCFTSAIACPLAPSRCSTRCPASGS